MIGPGAAGRSRDLGRPRLVRRTAWGTLAVILLLVAGCAGTSSPSGTATLTVSGAWVRVAPTTSTPTAAYLVIANPGSQSDALIAVTSPAATMIEIHRTGTDMNGMTGMAAVPRLDVPAGGTVRLEPGGFHLMASGLKNPLQAGSQIELDLMFEHAGRIVVQADIRAG